MGTLQVTRCCAEHYSLGDLHEKFHVEAAIHFQRTCWVAWETFEHETPIPRDVSLVVLSYATFTCSVTVAGLLHYKAIAALRADLKSEVYRPLTSALEQHGDEWCRHLETRDRRTPPLASSTDFQKMLRDVRFFLSDAAAVECAVYDDKLPYYGRLHRGLGRLDTSCCHSTKSFFWQQWSPEKAVTFDQLRDDNWPYMVDRELHTWRLLTNAACTSYYLEHVCPLKA